VLVPIVTVGTIRKWVISKSATIGEGQQVLYRNMDEGFALLFKDSSCESASAIFMIVQEGFGTFWKFMGGWHRIVWKSG